LYINITYYLLTKIRTDNLLRDGLRERVSHSDECRRQIWRCRNPSQCNKQRLTTNCDEKTVSKRNDSDNDETRRRSTIILHHTHRGTKAFDVFFAEDIAGSAGSTANTLHGPQRPGLEASLPVLVAVLVVLQRHIMTVFWRP